ncbi:hypothetical protein LJB42_000393 [Komagataella kurtzmanii]|nr:hypothetical protein LJB42_000393 [Komagataella kurtzmanii]
MNKVKQIEKLNQQELDQNIQFEASWHQEYRNSAYIYIGSLPYEITETDLLTIFSQYGVPTHVKLARDYANRRKSKGFAFLKYEDWRSTVLAVDNLNGIKIKDRTISVDHTTYRPAVYQDEDDERMDKEWEAMVRKEMEKDFAEGVKKQEQPPAQHQLISEGQKEQSKQQTQNDDNEDDADLEDPMKNFLSKG